MHVSYYLWIPCVSLFAGVFAGCGEGSRTTPQVVSSASEPASTDGVSASDGSDGSTDAGTSGSSSSDEDGPRLDLPDGMASAADDGGSACASSLDIVFAMDVSTSMGGFIDALAEEILAVDAALQALDLSAPPRYGLVVFVDDVVLLNGGAAYASVEDLRADFLEWSAFTATNQQAGGGGYNMQFPENSLDALVAAAEGFAWSPGNTDEALRVVIHTTDDTFWEGPRMADGEMIVHDYGETIDILQSRGIRVATFAATQGDSCECVDVRPGWFEDYEGQPSIPAATDGSAERIDDVLDGTVSLTTGIPAIIDAAICDPYEPAG